MPSWGLSSQRYVARTCIWMTLTLGVAVSVDSRIVSFWRATQPHHLLRPTLPYLNFLIAAERLVALEELGVDIAIIELWRCREERQLCR
jgi:hypothetical protein